MRLLSGTNSGLLLSIFMLFQASTTPPTSVPARPFRMGEKVMAQEKSGAWSPATIKRVGKTHFYVSYDGWPDSWDEWVPDSRVKTRPPGTPTRDPWKAPRNHKPNPIPPEPSAVPGAANRDAAPATPAAPPVDATNAETPSFDTPSAVFAADPATPRNYPTLNLPLKADPRSNFDNPTALLTAGTTAAIVHTDSAPGDNPYAPRLELFDLATARSIGIVQLPANTKPLALSPDGKTALAAPDAWALHNNPTLILLDINKPVATEISRFTPFTDGDSDAWNHVDLATFVSPTLIAAVSRGGRFSIIDLSATPPRALWGFPDARPVIAISPNGRYVASTSKGTVALIEAATGRTSLIFPITGVTALAYSPDGNRLAIQQGDRILVYTLTPTELILDTSLARKSGTDSSLSFVSNDLLLLGERRLLHVPSGLVTWTYKPPPGKSLPIDTHANRLVYLVPEVQKSPVKLRSLALPDPAATAAIPGLLKRNDAYIIQPGTAVALDVQTPEAPDAAPAVTAGLTDEIARAGLKLDPAAPIKLVARLEGGETKNVPYRLIGRADQTASIRERKWRIALELNGQTLWEQSGKDAPPAIIQIKEGQSIDDAIRAARATPESLFSGTSIPRRLAKPELADGAGETTLPN